MSTAKIALMVERERERERERETGLDLIRVIAILFVIGGHFFWLHTRFLETNFNGFNIFIQGSLMSLFFVSVPLFVLLSGYLNYKKKYIRYNIGIYKGLKKIISAYLIFSIISILFRIYYLGEHESIIGWITRILGFSAISYSWYVEMYIGLFLIMPFLNIIFEKLSSRKERLFLIGVFILITSLPILLNRSQITVIPKYFVAIAPITFYFVGAYIAAYKPTIKKGLLILSLIIICTADSLANIIIGKTFAPIGGEVWSLYYLITAIIVFLLLYDINLKSRIISKLSVYTLDIYLCCWIFDTLYYPIFKNHFFFSQQQFFKYFIIIVPLVFLSSTAVAFIKEKIIYAATKSYHKQRG
ncbi:MAG: acyltransferase family protein [Bacteroidales bacterium]